MTQLLRLVYTQMQQNPRFPAGTRVILYGQHFARCPIKYYTTSVHEVHQLTNQNFPWLISLQVVYNHQLKTYCFVLVVGRCAAISLTFQTSQLQRTHSLVFSAFYLQIIQAPPNRLKNFVINNYLSVSCIRVSLPKIRHPRNSNHLLALSLFSLLMCLVHLTPDISCQNYFVNTGRHICLCFRRWSIYLQCKLAAPSFLVR